MNKFAKRHNIDYVDTKILNPHDKITADVSLETFNKHYNKPVRGFAIVENSNGDIIDTPNLVLLQGREFLTQQLAKTFGVQDKNYLNYKVAYFGVGSGGADTGSVPSKIGPFDDNTDLGSPRKIYDVDTNDTNYNYINGGYLKKITADGGSVEVILEDHSFSVNGKTVDVQAYTTIKYTMIIRADETLKTNGSSFAFNEAALYAVQFDGDPTKSHLPARRDSEDELTRFDPLNLCFARFTTLTKFIEPADSFKITWYILL